MIVSIKNSDFPNKKTFVSQRFFYIGKKVILLIIKLQLL